MQDECIQTLVDLGLTLTQAKIYLSLARLLEGTNAVIAKASNMARQEVYRQMPKLLKIGLVEKIIDNPSRYKATPIRNGIAILIQRKTSEHNALKKKAKLFLKMQENKAELRPEHSCQFLIATEKTIMIKKYQSEIESAQVSLEAIGPAEANERAILDACRQFEKKMRQGVQVRIITEKLRDNEELQKNLENLQKNPLFEMRELAAPPPVILAITDRKRVDIVVPYPQSRSMADLWTDNISIVILAATYFDEMWEKAKRLKRNY